MERRRAIRRSVAADEPLAHAKLRTGGQLVVLDTSNWGALAETTERLLPGRHLDVHIVTPAGRTLVRSRVVRAFVRRIQSDAVHYHTALAFEQAIDTRPCEHLTSPVLSSLQTPERGPSIERRAAADIEFTERMST